MGTWPEAYPGYARFDDGSFVNQAHNDWVQWAAEGGLPASGADAGHRGLEREAGDAVIVMGNGLCFSVLLLRWWITPMQQRPALAAFFFALPGDAGV